MVDQLLTIKLFPPFLRPGLVLRKNLLWKLSRGVEQGRQFTLVSAPAGYGKTTLVREWLDQTGRPYCWLSLERTENHPALFCSYLVAALQQVDPSIGQSLQSSLDPASWASAPDGKLPELLARLVNEISLHLQPFTLVLDDYHVINELSVHSAMEFLLSHQPQNMHLVVITRQDPLLPLSALRASGRLAEIRLSDLRFSEEEAGLFLNETLGLGLDPEEVAILAARTEGWIAGLQLAGISLSEVSNGSSGKASPEASSRFIRNFAGDDRYIMDYLMDEVLSREPENVQAFLLNTSLLKQLCSPLCDALMGEDWLPGASQGILERLEKTNLFLIPLDNRRHWYRYHHLFADLLTSRLQSTSPERVSAIHARASAWYEQENLIPEAVDHSLLAEDFERALKLIEKTAEKSIWMTGDLPILLKWSRRLPEDILATRPSLSLYYARGQFFSGQVQTAEAYLDQADEALRERGQDDPKASSLWGVLWLNRATFAAMRGETQRALRLAAQAEERLLTADESTHARIYHARGMAELLTGQVRQAELAFEHGFRLTWAAANRNLGMDLAGCLAQTRILAGKLNQAAQACAEGLAAFPEGDSAPAACAIFLALGQIAFEQDQLTAAHERLSTCLTLAKQAGWLHVVWQAYILLAQVYQAQGDLASAQVVLEQADQLTTTYTIPRVIHTVAAARARLDLETGDLNLAQTWAEQYHQAPRAEYLQEFEDLTLARLGQAKKMPETALEILNRLLEPARQDGRLQSILEILTLRARLFLDVGEMQAACASLQEALSLAAPEGYLRIFLQEGRTLTPAYRALASGDCGTNNGSLSTFIQHILASLPDAQLETQIPASTPKLIAKGHLPGLIEPLSERELEVLRMIADGLTNPEIASRLFLSVNTLRAHTTNIYRKLDVHNRVQAVEKAHSLGILN